MISTNSYDIIYSHQNSSILVQNSYYGLSLTSMSLVLRGVKVASISSDLTSTLYKLTNKQCESSTANPPKSCHLLLGVIKQLIRDKNFARNIAGLSQNQ